MRRFASLLLVVSPVLACGGKVLEDIPDSGAGGGLDTGVAGTSSSKAGGAGTGIAAAGTGSGAQTSGGQPGTAGAGGKAGAGTSGQGGQTFPVGPGGGPAQGGSDAAGGMGSAESVQAFSRLLLGETTPDGINDPNAWRSYGFDLDAHASAPDQPPLCKLPKNGKAKSLLDDGIGGIDNSFGRNLMPGLFEALVVDPSHTVSEVMVAGKFSFLLDTASLGPASDYASLSARFLLAEGSNQPPAGDWTGYLWNPFNDPTSTTSQASLVGNSLDARFAQPVPLSLDLQGVLLALRVHGARLTLDLSDRKNGKNGQLGGVLDTEETVAAFHAVAGAIDSSLCGDSATFKGIADEIRKCADIRVDGAQDPNLPCDGISLGVGFTTKASGRGPGSPMPPDPGSCP